MKFIIKNRKPGFVHPDEKTEQYLAAHPWPPINITPERYKANDTWLRSITRGSAIGPLPLYYPDGETVRIMDEFEELHKAKK